jgi:hypothetical protein
MMAYICEVVASPALVMSTPAWFSALAHQIAALRDSIELNCVDVGYVVPSRVAGSPGIYSRTTVRLTPNVLTAMLHLLGQRIV